MLKTLLKIGNHLRLNLLETSSRHSSLTFMASSTLWTSRWPKKMTCRCLWSSTGNSQEPVRTPYEAQLCRSRWIAPLSWTKPPSRQTKSASMTTLFETSLTWVPRQKDCKPLWRPMQRLIALQVSKKSRSNRTKCSKSCKRQLLVKRNRHAEKRVRLGRACSSQRS